MRPYLENRRARFQISQTHALPFPEHLHSQVEMVYVFEGTARMLIDGKEYSVETGDVCICFPGVVHGYLEGSQDARTLMLIFPPEISSDFPALLARSYPQNPVIAKSQLSPDVTFCVEEIRKESMAEFDEKVIRGYLQVILARTMPLLTLRNRKPEMSDVVYEILKYLSQHYNEPMNLNDLAHALGVSRSYLSHTFSQRIGTNFRTYINTLRADQACIMLRNSTQSITNIAYECGFETQRTFNRVFSEIYGITPTQYRNQFLPQAVQEV